jgi:hypothetical protein
MFGKPSGPTGSGEHRDKRPTHAVSPSSPSVPTDAVPTDAVPTDAVLFAFLDEGLPPPQMAAIEQQLRTDQGLMKRLAHLRSAREVGVHTIGGIWREHRVSCPSRETLSGYLMELLTDEEAGYVQFHIHRIGCRQCAANLEDLQGAAKSVSAEPAKKRSRKYFETSVGRLRKKSGE